MIGSSLDILILGHNYAPEPIGIGPCTAEMAEALAESGHRVRVICGQPCYPAWKIDPAYRGILPRRSRESGVSVLRLPLYVPAVPRGWPRAAHHLCFALLAAAALIAVLLLRRRPDIVVAVAPSFLSAIVARLFGWAARRPVWVHVQDFELDMASATGQLSIADHPLMRRLQRLGHRGNRVSSISPAMCDKLVASGNDPRRVIEFRNWASPTVRPLTEPSPYRAQWRISEPSVALYSGNIAAKQGIPIIIEAAKLLAARRDLLFVICGDGPERERLEHLAAGCENVRIFGLQPMARLGDLLGLATIHLLPQIGGAADLVLPSKLPNMLASGRPIIATAAPGTGLAEEIGAGGLTTPPSDAPAFAAAIERLLDDAPLRAACEQAAKERAATRWSKAAILTDLERELRLLHAEWRALPSWRRSLPMPRPGLLAE